MKRTRSLAERVGGILIVGGLLGAGYTFWAGARHDNEESLRRRLHAANRTTSTGHTPVELASTTRPSSIVPQLDRLEPTAADWQSEVASTAIGAQLKQLSKRLEAQPRSAADINGLATANFQGRAFESQLLETVFQRGNCRVQRWSNTDDASAQHKATTLADMIDTMLGPQSSQLNRCAFKVTNIESQDSIATARVLLEAASSSDRGLEQVDAVLQTEWLLEDEPKMLSLRIDRLEKTALSVPPAQPWFDDVTVDVLSSGTDEQAEAYDALIRRDIGHWSERLSAIDDMSIYGHHGLAVADVNQDGLEDVYVCDAGGLPNRLYLQQPDGTARDVSHAAHVDWLESTSSALLVDLDNDGDPDLVAATVAGLVVAANNGSGIFQVRAAIPNWPESQSMCAADYDNDGDLDLYVTVYGAGSTSDKQRGSEASPPVPYHDANNGGRNVLLENQGGFQFVDATQRVGLDVNNRRFSFAASWEDFDVDGDMDLYVANDFGRNNLYRNDRGTFHDAAAELGVEDMAGGMSVSWGDANQDGRMDLYVGNMFSAAGNRVTYQRRFLSNSPADRSTGIQRMARGNTLFVGQSDGTFADVSESANVLMGRWAWSSRFVDLNNDGCEDLVVANGYFTNARPDDL